MHNTGTRTWIPSKVTAVPYKKRKKQEPGDKLQMGYKIIMPIDESVSRPRIDFHFVLKLKTSYNLPKMISIFQGRVYYSIRAEGNALLIYNSGYFYSYPIIGNTHNKYNNITKKVCLRNV